MNLLECHYCGELQLFAIVSVENDGERRAHGLLGLFNAGVEPGQTATSQGEGRPSAPWRNGLRRRAHNSASAGLGNQTPSTSCSRLVPGFASMEGSPSRN